MPVANVSVSSASMRYKYVRGRVIKSSLDPDPLTYDKNKDEEEAEDAEIDGEDAVNAALI